jgi:glycosyltransferase involved in cell wall biosynthesis
MRTCRGIFSKLSHNARRMFQSVIPMHVLYYLSVTDNLLYGPSFLLHGRFKTFGQHSYVLDVVAALVKTGIHVDLAVDNLSSFALKAPLSRICEVTEWAGRRSSASPSPSLIIVDSTNASVVPHLPKDAPIVLIVHRASERFPEVLLERVDHIACMTENAMELQAAFSPPDKLRLIRQGVDLTRFVPRQPRALARSMPELLWYTRLDRVKQSYIETALAELVRLPYRVTVIGDGEAFWAISDRFGDSISLLNFCPAHSIQNILQKFDIVISSGRGAMEALACGLPCVCIGFGFAGLIRPGNIASLLRYNLTGWRSAVPLNRLAEELVAAQSLSPGVCREMAERYLDIDETVRGLIGLIQAETVGDVT